VHPVGARQHGDVDVVVDHEQPVRLGGDGPYRPGSREQLASGQMLVAQLDDVRATPYGCEGERGQTRRVDVGGDEVEPAGR